jgi:hypothetical protein
MSAQSLEEILTVVRAAANAPLQAKAKLLDVDNALQKTSGLQHPRPLLHRWHGVQVELGLAGTLALDEAALQKLGPLGLSIAPELVERIPIGSSEVALVTRYRACERGELMAADALPGPFADAAVGALLADVTKLLAAGLTHAWAHRGLSYWLVASDTKAIVLDGWSEALEPLEGADPERALAKIEVTARSKV